MLRVLVLFLVAALPACEHRGNLRSAGDYRAPPAPKVERPWYDPYAAYGEANARWRPTVADRRGTIVRPGGQGGGAVPVPSAPPGTF